MQTFLVKVFGDNWRTTLFGIIQFVAGTAYNYIQSLDAGAFFDWRIFGTQMIVALLALLSKDSKVTGGSVQATK